MENSEFERAFVRIVAEKVDELQMSHSEFGRQVFGETSGVRLWRLCRAKTRTRAVTISEAVRMAEILGGELAPLMWQVQQSLHSGKEV